MQKRYIVYLRKEGYRIDVVPWNLTLPQSRALNSPISLITIL